MVFARLASSNIHFARFKLLEPATTAEISANVGQKQAYRTVSRLPRLLCRSAWCHPAPHALRLYFIHRCFAKYCEIIAASTTRWSILFASDNARFSLCFNTYMRSGRLCGSTMRRTKYILEGNPEYCVLIGWILNDVTRETGNGRAWWSGGTGQWTKRACDYLLICGVLTGVYSVFSASNYDSQIWRIVIQFCSPDSKFIRILRTGEWLAKAQIWYP